MNKVPKVVLICKNCKNVFYKRQKEVDLKPIHCCSLKCRTALAKETKKCAQCKKTFESLKVKNIQHCDRKCAAMAIAHTRMKLTKRQIGYIKRSFAAGKTRGELAIRYGVSPFTITRVISGKVEGK